MRKLLIALILFLPVTSFAVTRDDLMHFTAHTGASFTLQTVFYGVNSKWLGLPKPVAEGLALVETLAVGFIYKKTEGNPSNMNTAMLQNVLGATSAIATHVVFEF